MKTHFLAAVLLGAACAAAGAVAAPLDPNAGDAVVARQLSARFASDRTGACVLAAVIDHDEVRRARVCAASRADGPPDWEAAMEIGSVSKTMTAYLVVELVQRGRWSLDDPIAKFLPAGTTVPRQGDRQILVRDLLTHSAGLPALPTGVALASLADPYAEVTPQAVLDALGRTPLPWPIGSRASYSNFGMMLVPLAVARSEPDGLEPALRERLFQPLGMGAFIAAPGPEHAAPGHLPGGQRTPPWTITPDLGGFGMVKANLADMTRYARAALGDGPPEVVARLRLAEQPLAHGFAMNWMRRAIQGHDLVLHEGATGGFSSLVALDPAAHRAVVLLADTVLVNLGGLGDVGLKLLGLDVPVAAPRHTTPLPADLQRALVGDYRLGSMTMRIRLVGDARLMAQAQGQEEFELLHDSAGDLYPATFDALLTPIPGADPQAPVAGFAWRQGGGMQEARRIGEPAQAVPMITNPAWRDWAGEFELAPQFSLRVFEQDGRLMVRGTGQPAIAATPAGTDRIEIAQVGAVVEFERDASGKVVAAVLHQNGQTLRGLRR